MFYLGRRRRPNRADGTQVGDPITVSIVGLGAMGQSNLRHIRKSPNYMLIGVYDLRREVTIDVAGKFKAKPYESVEACINDPDTEAVFICTPHYLLAKLGSMVLEAGKHLLIEKPMAIDTVSADSMIELARERTFLVSVNYSRIFTDGVQLARRLFESGAVGDLIGVETRWSRYSRAGYYHGAHSPSPDDWRLDRRRAGGGMVMMTTCHAIHYVPHILGSRVTTAAAFIPPSVLSGDVEDTLQGILQFEGGETWAVLTSNSQRGVSVNDTTIWGTHGTIVLQSHQVRYYTTRIVDDKKPGVWHVEKQPSSEDHFFRWLHDTARSIRQSTPLEVSAESARDTIATITALYRSASSGTVVALDEKQPAERGDLRPVESPSV